MEFVKITRNNETKTVEKGAVHIYAMRGWTVDKGESKAAKSPYASTANTSYPYDKTNR